MHRRQARPPGHLVVGVVGDCSFGSLIEEMQSQSRAGPRSPGHDEKRPHKPHPPAGKYHDINFSIDIAYEGPNGAPAWTTWGSWKQSARSGAGSPAPTRSASRSSGPSRHPGYPFHRDHRRARDRPSDGAGRSTTSTSTGRSRKATTDSEFADDIHEGDEDNRTAVWQVPCSGSAPVAWPRTPAGVGPYGRVVARPRPEHDTHPHRRGRRRLSIR